MELIRSLLIHFEEYESFAFEKETLIEGYSKKLIDYHLLLLAQAGFIIYEADRSSTNPDRLIRVYPFGLSWAGHEFLDLSKNETLWKKAKDKLQNTTGALSLHLLKQLLTSYAKHELGLEK